MKNSTVISLFTLVLGLSLVFTGCKKEDTSPPTITVTGDASVSVVLGGSYTDQGATATDDVDGDLTSQITTDNTVDANTTGSYTVTYTVTDAAGNVATATRTVVVAANRDSYLGTYSTVEDCPSPYGLNSSPSIAAGSGADEIVLSLFYFNGGTLTMNVDGQNVTVAAAQAPAPWGSTITGSGTLNATGTVITMALTITPQVGAAVTCTVTWTKQ